MFYLCIYAIHKQCDSEILHMLCSGIITTYKTCSSFSIAHFGVIKLSVNSFTPCKLKQIRTVRVYVYVPLWVMTNNRLRLNLPVTLHNNQHTWINLTERLIIFCSTCVILFKVIFCHNLCTTVSCILAGK